MLFEHKRCIHCNSEYEYQASGDGCLDDLNDKDYCPECKKAIIAALAIIPKKFRGMWKSESFSPEFLKELFKLNPDSTKEHKVFRAPVVANEYTASLDYDHIEIYIKDRNMYAITWNNEEEYSKHYFKLYEYSLIKQEFTGKPWYVYTKDTFYFGNNLMRAFKKLEKIEVTPLPPPSKEIYWSDFTWEIIPKMKHK